MIDERELYGLADPGVGPAPAWPAVSAVLERGTRLRRRRHAVRSAGVGTVVVGVIGAGFVAVGRGSSPEDADVAIGDQPTPTTIDLAGGPPPPLEPCSGYDVFSPNGVDTAEVPDAVRVLPGWLPEGASIVVAKGSRSPDSDCAVHHHWPLDDALVLRSVDDAGVVDAQITVLGPLPVTQQEFEDFANGDAAVPASSVTEDEVTFRGGTATRIDARSIGGLLSFDWDDPEGWSWEIYSDKADEATLRAVGEALAVDSSPEGDEPLASLAPEALPAGFEIAWQARGAPVRQEPGAVTWEVTAEVPGEHSAELICMIETTPIVGGQPPEGFGGAGTGQITVNGHDAAWSTAATGGVPGQGNALTWEISPGVRAQAGCADWTTSGFVPLPVEDVKRFAESIEPVAADDPRIPPA